MQFGKKKNLVDFLFAEWSWHEYEYVDHIIMASLRSRCGHYIFGLFLVSFFSSPNLSGCRMDVYHTSTHDVVLARI